MTTESFLQLAYMGKLAMAFGGGLISFVSPCVLPLVPSYISFVTGVSFEELTNQDDSKGLKRVILLNSLMFVIGFSVVFVLVLGLSAQYVSHAIVEYKDIIRRIGGAVIFLLGIHVIGIINIKSLNMDKRFHFFKNKPQGLVGSFFVGVGFAAGWTPCIGPILSAIFAAAATATSRVESLSLFAAYSLGLAVPFMLTSLGINTFLKHFNKIKKHMRLVSIITGILLMVTGSLIFLNSFATITSFFYSIMPALG
ncbi:MAG: cytochrome c biogenesis protein CcdA [Deltaproteobacteria bacterium]|nr:cytochrome c biogenesis protein CcdA [Deltaproteobacteria bacterium]